MQSRNEEGKARKPAVHTSSTLAWSKGGLPNRKPRHERASVETAETTEYHPTQDECSIWAGNDDNKASMGKKTVIEKIVPQARAKRRLHRSLHGHARPDDFHWMRRPSPELSRLVDEENTHTDLVSSQWKVTDEELLQEFASRRSDNIQDDAPPVPTSTGALRVERHDPARGDHTIHVEIAPDGTEKVLVDLNQHEALIVGDVALSPCDSDDDCVVAYSIDEVGDEDFTFLFRKVSTGERMTDEITGAFYTCAWASKDTFLYVEIDDCHRPWRVLRHVLGTPSEEDDIVFEERDRLFEVTLSLSPTGDFVIIETTSSSTTGLSIISKAAPRASPIVLWPKTEGVLVDLTENGNHWFLCTNEGGDVQFRVDACSISLDRCGKVIAGTPKRSDWFTIIPHDPLRFRRYACAYEHGLALVERSVTEGSIVVVLYPRIRPRVGAAALKAKDDQELVEAAAPENRLDVRPPGVEVYDLNFCTDMPFNSRAVRFTYCSFLTPHTTVHADLATGEISEIHRRTVVGFDPSKYREGREWAVSDDGTRVPISYVAPKLVGDGGHGRGNVFPRPTVIRAYGAYGSSSTPTFNARLLSLLDRGIVYALAHVRGGSELGRSWYLDGRLAKKMNSFVDFIACTRHLIKIGISKEDRVVSWGRSAGGLLVTASANMTGSSLFRGIIARVPFVDVVTSMQDDSIPLIAQERLEWGNPDKVADYHTMLAYSPYDNIGPTRPKYVYVSAGLADSRVLVHEPLKYVAKLRAMTQGHAGNILLRVNDTGHFISEGRKAIDEDLAETYAFAIHVLVESN